MHNFDEQQIFQLKTTINHANERDSLFQIQKYCFICSIQQQKPSLCKISLKFCNSFESEYKLTHSNLGNLHQRHLNATL